MSPPWGRAMPAPVGAWGGDYDWRGTGGYPDPGAMLVVRQRATGRFFRRSRRVHGWHVAGGHGRHVHAWAAIAGGGHEWRRGQTCGQGDSVDFSLSAEQ